MTKYLETTDEDYIHNLKTRWRDEYYSPTDLVDDEHIKKQLKTLRENRFMGLIFFYKEEGGELFKHFANLFLNSRFDDPVRVKELLQAGRKPYKPKCEDRLIWRPDGEKPVV